MIKLRYITFIIFLAAPGSSSACQVQPVIPGVLVIHTPKKDGYFQICFMRDCIRKARGKSLGRLSKTNRKSIKKSKKPKGKKRLSYSKRKAKDATAKAKSTSTKKRKPQRIGRGSAVPVYGKK